MKFYLNLYKKKINRFKIRKLVLQILFCLYFNKDYKKIDIIFYIFKNNNIIINYIYEIPKYLLFLVFKIYDKIKFLDYIIKKFLNFKWNIDRISKIDFIILRIAIFEMYFSYDVPDLVALNEALELTKIFSNNNSKNFINGLLSNVFKKKKNINIF